MKEYFQPFENTVITNTQFPLTCKALSEGQLSKIESKQK